MDKTKGKLCLLYECNPFAFITELAGGRAINGKDRIVDLQPEELHQRTPFFAGSIEMISELEKCLQENLEEYALPWQSYFSSITRRTRFERCSC